MKRRCSAVLMAAALIAALVVPGKISAGDFYLDFSEPFAGTPPVSDTIPWIQALLGTIQPGHVQLTILNLNLSGTENIDQLYFNLNPALNLSSLSFTVEPGAGFDAPRIALGADQFKAGGDGRYDLKLTFASGGGASSRFGVGESFIANFFGTPAFSASDFEFLSSPVGSSMPFYAAAHVQRIGSTSTSGWLSPVGGPKPLPVPEPATACLWLLGGLLLATRKR